MRVGRRVSVGAGSVLLEGVQIGDDTRLIARVTLCAGAHRRERCVLQPGCVIGGDGFGHAPDSDGYVKVPQVGAVVIGNDVEVGSNSTIDRGAIGNTVIEDGVKIDNLVQVGHNVRVGAHTVIAACVGISGSTTIGKRCMLGGMVGVAGHLDDLRRRGVDRPHRGLQVDRPARRLLGLAVGGRGEALSPQRRALQPARRTGEARSPARDRGWHHASGVATMNESGGFDIDEVMRRLPHRYPMLLVDRVLECVSGERIVALKNVTMNEEYFVGHFPGRPVMPGVLILEAMAQTAGILTFVTAGVYPDECVRFYFAGIDKARFRRPVVPGDQVMLTATLERRIRTIWKYSIAATVDGVEVASAEMMVMPG